MNSKLRKNEKRLMKQTLTENGITLIALVVTIVVLLILASVSITAVFGDNGLLQLAKEAGDKTNEAVKNDLQGIQNLTTDLDDIINPPVEVSKLTEIVTENTKAIDKNGNKLIIPAGFKVLADTDDNNVKYEDPANPTVEDGIVILDSTGNEFVWVPVFDETPIYTIYDGKNIGLLYDFGKYESSQGKLVEEKTVTSIEWNDTLFSEPNTVKTYEDGSGIEHKGDDNNENLNILGVDSITDFKTQLQKEFDYLVASVNKYKGFYIGRYETGNLQSNKENIPLVQKENTNIGNVNWYYMYTTSKNISLKNTDERVKRSVTSSMIWGSQWDAVMNWFLKYDDTKGYVTDSTDKGNYSGTQGEENKAIPTGLNPEYAVKNIYDMAGNVREWTIETYKNECRVHRGASYLDKGSTTPAKYRSSGGPEEVNPTLGSRCVLIINIPSE